MSSNCVDGELVKSESCICGTEQCAKNSLCSSKKCYTKATQGYASTSTTYCPTETHLILNLYDYCAIDENGLGSITQGCKNVDPWDDDLGSCACTSDGQVCEENVCNNGVCGELTKCEIGQIALGSTCECYPKQSCTSGYDQVACLWSSWDNNNICATLITSEQYATSDTYCMVKGTPVLLREGDYCNPGKEYILGCYSQDYRTDGKCLCTSDYKSCKSGQICQNKICYDFVPSKLMNTVLTSSYYCGNALCKTGYVCYNDSSSASGNSVGSRCVTAIDETTEIKNDVNFCIPAKKLCFGTGTKCTTKGCECTSLNSYGVCTYNDLTCQKGQILKNLKCTDVTDQISDSIGKSIKAAAGKCGETEATVWEGFGCANGLALPRCPLYYKADQKCICENGQDELAKWLNMFAIEKGQVCLGLGRFSCQSGASLKNGKCKSGKNNSIIIIISVVVVVVIIIIAIIAFIICKKKGTVKGSARALVQ